MGRSRKRTCRTYQADGRWRWEWDVPGGGRKKRRGFARERDAVADFEVWLAGWELERELGPRLELAAVTLGDHVAWFLEHFQGSPARRATLRSLLRRATADPPEGFGADRLLVTITKGEVALWRARQPGRVAHWAHQALAQALQWAIDVREVPGLVANPARQVRNTQPPPSTRDAIASWEEVEAIAAEISAGGLGGRPRDGKPRVWTVERADPQNGRLVRFMAATGLRPSEALKLERRDIDREGRVLNLRAEATKTRRARQVPLSSLAVEVLAEQPPRIDTPLVFATTAGDPIDLRVWRRDFWRPAISRLGLGVDGFGRPRRLDPYSLRHYFANSLTHRPQAPARAVLAAVMGSDPRTVDRYYVHAGDQTIELVRSVLEQAAAEARP